MPPGHRSGPFPAPILPCLWESCSAQLAPHPPESRLLLPSDPCVPPSSRHPPWVPSWLFLLGQTLNSSGPEDAGLTHFSQAVLSLASDTTAPVMLPRFLALLFPLCELASLPALPFLSCPSYSRKSHLHPPMQDFFLYLAFYGGSLDESCLS